MDQEIVIAIIGLSAGILGAIIAFVARYLFDYRIAKRKLQIEEQASLSIVLGSSQPNLIRAARDLYNRFSNFFEDPDKARDWLKPAKTPDKDGYYLHEFVWRLFSFIAWGRITQDAINSLPTAVTKERLDIQRTYLFVDLSNSLLTYTWLFQGFEDYEDRYEQLHIFTGNLDAIAEEGVRLWKEGGQSISRDAFNSLYSTNDSILCLREFIIKAYKTSDETGFMIARMAALRAVLAGFLAEYSWTIEIPNKKRIYQELQEHLLYASRFDSEKLPFVDLVPRNLGELMERYRYKLM